MSPIKVLSNRSPYLAFTIKMSVETNSIGWPIFSVLSLLGLNVPCSGPSFQDEVSGPRSGCGGGAVLKLVHKFVYGLKFLYSTMFNEIFNNSV